MGVLARFLVKVVAKWLLTTMRPVMFTWGSGLGFGFRVLGVGCRVYRVWGVGCRVYGAGCRVRVYGAGFRV